MKIALIQPPFYRLVGSHNNNVPVELSYWADRLYNKGHDVRLYNGDYSNAKKHWSWRTLMSRTDLYKKAVDGAVDLLLYEILESILAYQPDLAVISGDDTFMASKCNGNPFVAARLADLCTTEGIRTVGVGTFPALDPQFLNHFDCVVSGGPNEDCNKIIDSEGLLELGAWDGLGKPYFGCAPGGDLRYVVNSKGCNFPCTFCYNTKVSPEFIFRPFSSVEDDLNYRIYHAHLRDLYFTDQIFNKSVERLKELANWRKYHHEKQVKFTVEGRAELMTDEKAELMAKISVDIVKFGVENIGPRFGAECKKKQKVKTILDAVEMCRKNGIKVAAYLMLGASSKEEYYATLDFCRDVDFDRYIISILSQPMSDLGTDRYKYDTHWSTARLDQWVIEDGILDQYLKLQESKLGNPGLQMIA